MTTGLERIATKARKDSDCRFSSLTHHIDSNLLRKTLYRIKPSSARGVDRESVQQARSEFSNWSTQIIDSVNKRGYRPPPVKRVFIPKPGKLEMRPLGVPTIRDRCLQAATAKVLEPIYESDFLDCSFGGRPGRSAHGCIATLSRTISTHKVSWVFEADLKNFFGSLDHGCLLQFVAHRVSDPRILTLIRRWLKAGAMEGSEWSSAEAGVPQGGSISVILSNVYLHYVLDLWFEKIVKPRLAGEAYLIRYLDDFVVCFQLKKDADRFISALSGRLDKFKLKLEPSKTRLVEFGRFSLRDFKSREVKAPTLKFLGFTLHHMVYPGGNYGVGLKTEKSRQHRIMAKLKDVMSRKRHQPLADQMQAINLIMRGHFNYFGVPNNSGSLTKVHRYAVKQWRKSLSRRSQSGRINWNKFNKILSKFPLVQPKLKYRHDDLRKLAML